MKDQREKGFVLLVLAALIALPVAQWCADLAAGVAPTGSGLVRRWPTAAHLRVVEAELVEAARRNPYANGLASLPMLAWLRGQASPVLEGRVVADEPWLFYRPDVRLVSQRPAPAVGARAGSAILDWHRQCAARGIRLIVVVAPLKPALLPDRVARRFALGGVAWRSPETAAILGGLRGAGVEVVDLPALFGALPPPGFAEEPWYEPADTHWSQRGLHVAADAIVASIGWERVPGVFAVREEMIRRPADLAKLLPPAWLYEERPKEACLVVTDLQGRAPTALPGAAEVLLLGDSFCRIFEEGEVVGAGLRSQLAWRLGRPVGLIRQDGGGATLVRQELARKPEWLRGVKVVVWEFAERDLLSADAEWAKVEVPR
jgi:hypothetical protein